MTTSIKQNIMKINGKGTNPVPSGTHFPELLSSNPSSQVIWVGIQASPSSLNSKFSGHFRPTRTQVPPWSSYCSGHSSIHWLLLSTKGLFHPVQLLSLPLQVDQLESQVLQTPLTATSLVLVQLISQVLAIVTTRLVTQEVQVVWDISQVKQEPSQGKQFEPLSIVLPDSQVPCQVLSLISSFMLETQDVHVVVNPEHVLQLSSHGNHESLAES